MNGTSMMNGMKFFPVIALSLLFAAGCAPEGDEVESLPVPLTFSTSVSAQTRAEEITTDNLTAVGIFASLTQGGFNAITATPNFMYNQKLEKSGGAWTYSPMKYWPDNKKDCVSFFAYAPYVDEKVTSGRNPTFSGSTAKGYPTLTYSVPDWTEYHQDLLASVPLLDQTYENTVGGRIGFTMKHALSRVKISIKSEMAIKIVTLGIINVPMTATLTFNESGFSWGKYTNTTSCMATLDGGSVSVAANATQAKDLATYFLFPNKASAIISLTYRQEGESSNVSRQTDFSTDLVQGEGMSIQLNVKKGGLSVTATADTEWGNGGEQAVVSDVAIPGYRADDLKIGDYYYSDGTTSDGGYRKYYDGTTELLEVMPVSTDASGNLRSVVGIVFHVGKHETDTDSYLNTGLRYGRVRGYAFALKDASEGCAWEDKDGAGLQYPYMNLSSNDRDWQGFYNQRLVEKFVAETDGWQISYFPAFNVCKNYTPAAPSKSSGWFLPSLGQLKAISEIACLNSVNISPNIGRAGGEEYYNNSYWSSSEYKDGKRNLAYAYLLYVPDVPYESYLTRSKDYHVRPILAF